jgi:RNA polymerase sigma-54 factor
LLLGEEFLGNINEEGYLAASLEDILNSVNLLLQGHVRRAEEEDDQEADGEETDGEETDGEAAVDDEAVGTVAVGAASPTRPSATSASASSASSSTAAPSAASSPPLYTMQEAEEMLAVIQRLDPSGTGARDLRECLLIQLVELADTSSLTYRLVAEAFPDLIAHRWNDLAKRFGVEPGAVQTAADQLSRLDPKPGLKYSQQSDGYIIPDLIVEKIGNRYQVFLNDTGMPRLRLSRSYQEIARDKKKMTPENREFIASKMNSANWMIQAIEQRRQTMLKVMNFIVDRQRDFFEKGIEYLKPLTLREVAEVINMHESTVSRVTNEKYVQTPRGVLPLKFFFSSALSTASGEDASARSIRAKLEKMVAEENSGKPLTDQQIVHLFQEQGIQIARRTVAKYRDQLGILPARMRKRV